MLLVYTIVEPAAVDGWGATSTLAFGGASLVLLAAFIVRQDRARNPLMPLRVFRSRNVTGTNLVQVVVIAGMFGMFFMGTLYLEQVLGFDPLEIGLAFLPSTIVMGVFSAGVSARLTARYGAYATLVPALVLVAAGLALFARAPVEGSYWVDVLPAVLVLGVGAGLAFPSLMTLAMTGVDPADAGLASGLVNTTAQVGGALGLAVLATLSSSRSEALLAGGESVPAALTGGYQLAFVVGAGLVVAGIAIALVLLRPQRAPGAQRADNLKPALSEG
jgi:predicted MFS family arabinose efflux permease